MPLPDIFGVITPISRLFSPQLPIYFGPFIRATITPFITIVGTHLSPASPFAPACPEAVSKLTRSRCMRGLPKNKSPTCICEKNTNAKVSRCLLKGVKHGETQQEWDVFFHVSKIVKDLSKITHSAKKGPCNKRTLGIQSPSENGFMEPKYYAEKVIGHPLLIS